MLNGLSGVELICIPIQSAGSYVVPELVEVSAWQIEFASAHAVRHLADKIDRSVAGEIPLVAGSIEPSLWLREL